VAVASPPDGVMKCSCLVDRDNVYDSQPLKRFERGLRRSTSTPYAKPWTGSLLGLVKGTGGGGAALPVGGGGVGGMIWRQLAVRSVRPDHRERNPVVVSVKSAGRATSNPSLACATV